MLPLRECKEVNDSVDGADPRGNRLAQQILDKRRVQRETNRYCESVASGEKSIGDEKRHRTELRASTARTAAIIRASARTDDFQSRGQRQDKLQGLSREAQAEERRSANHRQLRRRTSPVVSAEFLHSNVSDSASASHECTCCCM